MRHVYRCYTDSLDDAETICAADAEAALVEACERRGWYWENVITRYVKTVYVKGTR